MSTGVQFSKHEQRDGIISWHVHKHIRTKDSTQNRGQLSSLKFDPLMITIRWSSLIIRSQSDDHRGNGLVMQKKVSELSSDRSIW